MKYLFPKGEKHPLWKGGKSNHSEGYIEILDRSHPFCNNKGYVLEHRLVMEKHLGRLLRRDELIHHINGNKRDNRLENLQLMTRAEHQKHHQLIDMTGRYCSKCGSFKTKPNAQGRPNWLHDLSGNMICNKCYMKEWHRQREEAGHQ